MFSAGGAWYSAGGWNAFGDLYSGAACSTAMPAPCGCILRRLRFRMQKKIATAPMIRAKPPTAPPTAPPMTAALDEDCGAGAGFGVELPLEVSEVEEELSALVVGTTRLGVDPRREVWKAV